MTSKNEWLSLRFQSSLIKVLDAVVLTVLVVSVATVLTMYFLWNHVRGKHEDNIP